MSVKYLYDSAVPHSIVASAGGVSACLTTSGALAALQLLGPPSRWRSLWCCSGSAAPIFMWAAGKSPSWIMGKMVEYDFSRLFPAEGGFLRVAKEILRCELFKLPIEAGLRNSKPYGFRIQKHCPEWPLNVKTMATSGTSVIVFDSEGSYEYSVSGVRRILSNQPASVSDAVRATATIPVWMTPIQHHGFICQDGCLSKHTSCPTTLATMHDGTREEDIIALLSAKQDSRSEKWTMNIGRHLAGNHSLALEQHAKLMIKPLNLRIGTTDFDLPRAKKEAAILAGFHATLLSLQEADFLQGAVIGDIIAKTQTMDELLLWSDAQFGA